MMIKYLGINCSSIFKEKMQKDLQLFIKFVILLQKNKLQNSKIFRV